MSREPDDIYNRGTIIIKNNSINEIIFCDEYEHKSETIEYVPENILQTNATESESFIILRAQFNTFLQISCDCKTYAEMDYNLCGNSSTTCCHGQNYQTHFNGRNQELILNPHRRSKDLIYECSDQCSCETTCTNRLVQFGPRKNLQIADFGSLKKNFGLITLDSIPAGGFICEYAGEILTKEEAAQRHSRNDAEHLDNYVICLNERSSEISERAKTVQTFIDPSRCGNIGRYLNHSCDANCEIFIVRIDGPIPKLGLFQMNCFLISNRIVL